MHPDPGVLQEPEGQATGVPLSGPDGWWPARVNDVSQVGLRLVLAHGFAPGSMLAVELRVGGRPIPLVHVVSDHPVRACLASQYAGWAIRDGKYFAMGSGPMRAAAGDATGVLSGGSLAVALNINEGSGTYFVAENRNFKGPIDLIYDNVLYSTTSAAKSMFNFLVCAGAPGIGDYFSSCYSTNLTI